MGNITDPPAAGDDCIECFDAGETPSKIAVKFADIVQCFGGPPDPNGTFVLEQDPVKPCEWNFVDGLVAIYYFSDDLGNSRLQQWWGAWEVFTASVGSTCVQSFNNELVCAVDFEAGEAGTGTVYFDLAGENHVVGELMTLINMEKEPNTKYEIFDVDVDQDVILLARKQDGTNIRILIDEEDF